ncbi:MAG: hypothetical protein UHW99_01895, partial [Methanobrevibacter sp.]|nr:hypothetical protein [Methanobrevibacter sp.]
MTFKKEIITILLIICVLFTISAISAADSGDEAVSVANDTVKVTGVNVNSENNLQKSNDDVEILGDTDDGSFAALQTKVSGASGTVPLENDYEYKDTDNGNQGIFIMSAITIDGQGHTIDAKGKSAIFVAQASNVVFKNITFKNGNSSYGGAIYGAADNINVVNCTFIGNTAYSGAAIYSNADNNMGTISGSTFINNKATNGNVLYNYGYDGTVDGCIFVNNEASASLISTYQRLNLQNSIFSANTATYLVNGAYSTITANKNWFGNNKDNMDEAPNIQSSIDVTNWYILDLELNDGTATLSLKLYDNTRGIIESTYDAPKIKFDLTGVNVEVPSSVTLDDDGKATFTYEPADAYSITASYYGSEVKAEITPTFKLINDKINNNDISELTLDQDIDYDPVKDSSLTNGIEFAKDMIIDGQGHILDAKGLSNIIYFNDDTHSKNLILKNLVFKNAVGTDGAAVYFKGNKIEVINCTFINNTASGQGDALYIIANSNENRITESAFIDNTGSNSIIHLDSGVAATIDNSLFIGNSAADNIVGSSNVLADYNWWGNTAENYNTDIAKVNGATVNKWLFVKIDANPAVTGTATLSLNNLYDSNGVSTYDDYALPAVSFTLRGSDATPSVDAITIEDGQSTYQFTAYKIISTLTAECDGIQTSKQLDYVIVDDGSFKALHDRIWFSSEDDVIEFSHNYTYVIGVDTITTGIPVNKKITINGNGYTIDAKGKSGIFINNVQNVNYNDIIFVNGKFNYGSAIYDTKGSINVDGCTFINNTAKIVGGAICSTPYGNLGNIVNSVFINNSAPSDGAAIFSNAYNGGNINGCIFINNTSPLHALITAYYQCAVHNSIILNNDVLYTINGDYTSGMNINYNWWGASSQNNQKPSEKATVSNWLIFDVVADIDQGVATVSLNNLNSGSTYASYALPKITLNIKSKNAVLDKNTVTIDETGKATVNFEMTSDVAYLTFYYEGFEFTKIIANDDSFTSLNDKISSTSDSIFYLDKNYTYNESLDSSLTNGIEISKSITIDGQGHTLDAKGLSRIFYFSDTNRYYNLILKNINFVNGKSTKGGSLYFLGKNIDIINCTFENSTSTDHGGAVYLDDSGTNIINSTFIKNAINVNTKYGGAVFIQENGGQNNFINSTFINNTVNYWGGAIATLGGKAINNVDKCIFITNGGSSGKSIYIGSPSSTASEFYLKNSIILSNDILDSGNQVYAYYGTFKASEVDNNWLMNTINNYNVNYARISGAGMTVNKWLYLDITCENEVATISINNVYDNIAKTTSKYDGELPKITFDLTALNAVLPNNVTLDKTGEADVGYDLTAQTGSLTATYHATSLTKELTSDESFTTLANKINRAEEGSTLTLSHDYKYDSAKDSALTNGIEFGKTLTIDGQGHTLDAQDSARIFNFNDNTKDITLKNIKFVNAKSDENGAAVYANCNNIEVLNCTFELNDATANGDALYVIANSADISKSIFINNIGTASVIYLDSTSPDAAFNIDNSIFVNNDGSNVIKTGNVDLTADYNWFGNTHDNSESDLSNGLATNWYVLDMTVDDEKSLATITLNNLFEGGSTSPYENYALPTIIADIQTNAYASARKDAVAVDKDGDGVNYFVTDEQNPATITVSYNGVSITREIHYNDESDYSFTALKKLIDNAQDNDVITLEHDYEYVIGYDTITDGISIVQNNLTINGNGYTINAKGQTRIFNVGTSTLLVGSNVTMKNTTFVNGIKSNGGAIRWYADDGNIINCTFEKNSAANVDGGAIYTSGKNLNIFNSTFNENKANRGGAIFVDGGNVNINGSTFFKNGDGAIGGAIYLQINTNNLNVTDSTFISNLAATSGGAIYTATSNVDDLIILNSTFIDNSAPSGGALYLANAKYSNITDSKFISNRATTSGGAIYIWSTFDTFIANIYNSTFTDNTAPNGGAIYDNVGILNVNKSDFINNMATVTSASKSYGGAIYTITSKSVNITNSNFIGNNVKTTSNAAYGGALYIGKGEINIENSTFEKNGVDSNSASTYGSVIYWYDNAKGNITNSSFLNNHGKSNYYASAIYLTGTNSKINVSESIFLNNTYGSSNILRDIYRGQGTIDFNYCWFGNTKDTSGEQMGAASGTGITYNTKLELNVVPDEYMVVGEDKDIKFVFTYVENAVNKVYDSSNLPKVNLTLTPSNGKVNKNNALVDENILFNADQRENVKITASYNVASLTVPLEVKYPVKIIADDEITIHVGVDVHVPAELSESAATGVLKYSGGDEFIDVSDNGYVTGLKYGTSVLTIFYTGDDNYAPVSVNVIVNVVKNSASITVTDENPIHIKVNDENIQLNYTKVSDATINFVSNDTSVLEIDPATGVMTGKKGGVANITISLPETDKYEAKSVNIIVTVDKIDADISAEPFEVSVGEEKLIDVNVPGDFDGTVSFVSAFADNLTVESKGKVT